jgi:ATP phosphoribosyltransferase
LIASCSTDIAVLGTQQISAKIEDDNRLTRIFTSFPEMSTTYYRCKF